MERESSSMGFFGALMFNGTLSGFRAGLVEAVFAVDQIPRAPYEDPFRALFARNDPASSRQTGDK